MKLWISGASGAALEAWAVVQALRDVQAAPDLAGFLSLDGLPSFPLEGLKCMRESDFLATVSPDDAQVVLAIGNPNTRCSLAEIFAGAGFSFPTLVHPSAVIGRRVTLGAGTIVMAGSVLETSLSVGEHCLINVQATIAHECVVGSYCNLGPGSHLAGFTQIGDRSDLGTGCIFRPGIKLGTDMVVGAGAVVVDDWPGSMTIVGIPAKPLHSSIWTQAHP